MPPGVAELVRAAKLVEFQNPFANVRPQNATGREGIGPSVRASEVGSMRFQIRTRRIMVLVAVAAVLLATPGELRNRRERRRIARIRVYHLDLAAIHDAEGGRCLASAGSRAYDSEERRFARPCEVPAFASWADEAAYHARKARDRREAAAINVVQERAARRRLILPVIFDIRSSRR